MHGKSDVGSTQSRKSFSTLLLLFIILLPMLLSNFSKAVSRHGINKGETGPMLRASFEETVEVFMNSAAFSHYDMFNGVTENVMLGQLGKLGTGLVDLLLDQSKLSAAIDTMVSEDNGVFDEEIGAADALFKENGDATPFTTNTPYTNASPGWIGGR